MNFNIEQIQSYLDEKDAADTRTIKAYPYPDDLSDFLRLGESKSTKILVEFLELNIPEVDWTRIYSAASIVDNQCANYRIFDHYLPGKLSKGYEIKVSCEGITIEEIEQTLDGEFDETYGYSDTPRSWGIEGW
jgi:hypothetical protein